MVIGVLRLQRLILEKKQQKQASKSVRKMCDNHTGNVERFYVCLLVWWIKKCSQSLYQRCHWCNLNSGWTALFLNTPSLPPVLVRLWCIFFPPAAGEQTEYFAHSLHLANAVVLLPWLLLVTEQPLLYFDFTSSYNTHSFLLCRQSSPCELTFSHTHEQH